jgi:Tol biopolymer transport system component
VAFVSFADDVVEGDDGDGQPDVFVRHLDSGVTERANVSLTGVDSNSADYGASRYSETSNVISADGRFVAFESSALDLVTGATGGGTDIFVRDLVADVTTLASDDPRAAVAFAPAMSADGASIAYVNSQFGQINGGDVLVRDLVTGTTAKANVDTGQPASFGFFAPSLSADGRLVAFESSAVNELPDNTPVSGDVYVRDLTLSSTTRLSVDADGGPPDGASFLPEISADGSSVAYVSEATDLVPDDDNGLRDIFVTALASTGLHDRLSALRDLIVGFDLPQGVEGSLVAKVERAIRATDAGEEERACHALVALSNQSRAQGGRKLSADQATMIITAATDVRDALGCDRP